MSKEMEDARVRDDMNSDFKNGKVWDLDDETLMKYLNMLNSGNIPNDQVRHRAIIRAQTINFIQTKRLLDEEKKSNANTQKIFLFLAVGSLLIGFLSLSWQIGAHILKEQEPVLLESAEPKSSPPKKAVASGQPSSRTPSQKPSSKPVTEESKKIEQGSGSNEPQPAPPANPPS